MSRFTLINYPKSYASIKVNDFRLREFLQVTDEELEKINAELLEFCFQRADEVEGVKVYKNYSFIDAGWEWSAFKKDEKTILKIPAEVFPEVNEPVYLKNSEYAYEMIKKYFPAEFIAETSFRREDDLNLIEQEFISGNADFLIKYEFKDKKVLNNLRKLMLATLDMLKEVHWAPDFWLEPDKKGYRLRNVIIEKETGLPKIIDFTSYFDPFRLYPAKTNRVQVAFTKKVNDFIEWIDSKG